MNVEAALLTRVGDGADIPWRDSLASTRCCAAAVYFDGH
jgi:hypothetical protein